MASCIAPFSIDNRSQMELLPIAIAQSKDLHLLKII